MKINLLKKAALPAFLLFTTLGLSPKHAHGTPILEQLFSILASSNAPQIQIELPNGVGMEFDDPVFWQNLLVSAIAEWQQNQEELRAQRERFEQEEAVASINNVLGRAVADENNRLREMLAITHAALQGVFADNLRIQQEQRQTQVELEQAYQALALQHAFIVLGAQRRVEAAAPEYPMNAAAAAAPAAALEATGVVRGSNNDSVVLSPQGSNEALSRNEGCHDLFRAQ